MKIIKNKLNAKLPKGSFARNTATLMTGTIIAQVIPIAVSPLLTRIYSPSDFGGFALFISTTLIINVLATARYENAIMLPDEDSDAVNVVALSLLLASIISLLVLLTALFFDDYLIGLTNSQGLEKWLFFCPVTVLLTGVYQSFYNWLNRLGRYKMMAYRSVIQAVTTACMSLIFGYVGLRSTGLVYAFILGQIVTVLFMLYDVHLTSKDKWGSISIKKMIAQAKRYVKFPLYDGPSVFVSIFTNQIPVFMFTKFFGSSVVGLYSLTNRVVGMPSTLISGSVASVFKQRVNQDFNKYGNCIHIYKKTLKSLSLLCIGPFLVLFFFSPFLFGLVFGSEWRQAGEFARIMSFMVAIRFVVSPLSYVFFATQKQYYDFIGQVIFFLSTVASIAIGVHYKDVKLAIIVLTITYSAVYLAYLFVSYKLAKGSCVEAKK